MSTTTNKPLLDVMRLTRPRLERTYGDENALAVMGAVVDAIRQIGRACDYDSAAIREAGDAVKAAMFSGDNEHLLAVAREYVTLAGDGRDEEDDYDD